MEEEKLDGAGEMMMGNTSWGGERDLLRSEMSAIMGVSCSLLHPSALIPTLVHHCSESPSPPVLKHALSQAPAFDHRLHRFLCPTVVH